MLKRLNDKLSRIAEEKGYLNKDQMLKDYNILPTVLVPKHNKFELLTLLLKSK